ncbi:duf1446 domain-containing protein [Fusarium napiforme]|uniref:Duf1446 domain-containing protein n=1 Tax=Fusarium napiforme TaxID=42672 RepID=A0A8H5N8R4_9HYPO|nr:duf1446 domain-containing protein [Fusarium napiforme]
MASTIASSGVTNGSKSHSKRPVVIAGCSGGTVDRARALKDLSKLPNIDVIVGDWMSEADMTVNGAKRAELKKHVERIEELGQVHAGYHGNFLDKLAPALEHLHANNTKVACNAGGSNAHGLAVAVTKLVAERGLPLKVGWIEGDDVSDTIKSLIASKENDLASLTSGKPISEWPFEPLSAQCYLGGFGVARALRDCDIVICGRVADSSLCVGAAAWWHGWTEDHIDELARALVAGHLIECSTYSTGGCFSGFKKWHGNAVDLGFPIAIIDSTGETEITLEPGKDGEVSVETLTSQLVYEIQGPKYYNSSVIACLEGMQMEEVASNRVVVRGVRGLPPPTTTKVGITAAGGYRAEYHIYLAGLDIEEKVAMTKAQIIACMGPDNYSKFSLLEFQVLGRPDPEARRQDSATVDVRIFAQSSDPELLSPGKFLTWCKTNILQSCPGLTPTSDARQGVGIPYYEYWVTLMDQSLVKETVHLPTGQTVEILPSRNAVASQSKQDSYETSNPLPAGSWGPTRRAPLGSVVYGRSGDKSSDANVGFFVRNDDEWGWLRSTLTVQFIRQLLGDDDSGKPIERFEIHGLKAVHFLLKDHLDRGYSAGAGLDCLGKNLVEYLRAKVVDLPAIFLERGRI